MRYRIENRTRYRWISLRSRSPSSVSRYSLGFVFFGLEQNTRSLLSNSLRALLMWDKCFSTFFASCVGVSASFERNDRILNRVSLESTKSRLSTVIVDAQFPPANFKPSLFIEN